MQDPGENHIKAWAKEYEEAPFFFEQHSAKGTRLVGWSENPIQTKEAFYSLLSSFSHTVAVLLKISVGIGENGNPLWARYWGELELEQLTQAVQSNETYVFSDGMHQLCVKELDDPRYIAFDEHGIFFIYSFNARDIEVFHSLDFKQRFAEPLFAVPHFHHTSADSEVLEQKFVSELGLQKAESDLD